MDETSGGPDKASRVGVEQRQETLIDRCPTGSSTFSRTPLAAAPPGHFVQATRGTVVSGGLGD